MKAAASGENISYDLVKKAKEHGCKAFRDSRVHGEELRKFIAEHEEELKSEGISRKDQKMDEEIRKLRIANDKNEGKSILKTLVDDSIKSAHGQMRQMLEQYLLNESPTATAGMDPPQVRIFNRRIIDKICVQMQQLEKIAVACVALAFAQSYSSAFDGPIYDWAARNIWLSPPITKTGPFDISSSRHFIAIFDSLQNDRKREVNILKPVRGGGSLVGDIWCPWTIAEDPGPIMEVFQTDKVGSDHAEERSKRIFDHCEAIKKYLPANRHKERDNEILFTRGTWYNRGPSLANLQAKGIRYLREEEVWMWDQGKMAEAEGRIGDYLKMQISKICRISQGGPADGVGMEESDWYQAYHKGQIHEWEVACQNCGKYFDPVFAGLREDGSFYGVIWNQYKTATGDWDISKCIPTIRFECPHCAHPMLDNAKTKSEWNRTGRYRTATANEGKKDSFHWEAVIDYPWDELVELWLNACNAEKRGDLKPKIQFYQKRRAMFKDLETLRRGDFSLARKAYEIESEWPEEIIRGMQIDRQGLNLFWWSARAWSNRICRRLGFGMAIGFEQLEEIRQKYKVQANRTFIDSAYRPKNDTGVYAACLKYGWTAVRGDAAYYFDHKRGRRYVQKSYQTRWGDPGPDSELKGKACPIIYFSKPQLNDKVQELIDNGSWEEPQTGDPELEDAYMRQMSARVRELVYDPKAGRKKLIWKEGQNDHARDLANQAVLLGILGDVLMDPATEVLSQKEKQNA